MSSTLPTTSGGRPGSSRLTGRASRSGSSPVRKGELSLSLRLQLLLLLLPDHSGDGRSNLPVFLSPRRVEKKERARLKTVKFHARTGMIESNRVSVAGQLLPAPPPLPF